jgi:hypothetical protein
MLGEKLTKGEEEDEAVPLKKQVFFVESPQEDGGKGKAPIEHSGVPPLLYGADDFIDPALSPEEGAGSTQSGTTPPPAPSHSAGGGEVIEISSSPEPEGVVDTTLEAGIFDGLEPLLLDYESEVPETTPAGPSGNIEARGQAKMDADPSQSRRELDGAERGANSSKSKRSLEEMDEKFKRWIAKGEAFEVQKEEKKRKIQLEALSAYPVDAAKAELITKIINNSFFRGKLLSLGFHNPFLTGQGKQEALEKTIDAILRSRGKSAGSLSDLLDFQCDLEDPKRREAALRPYLRGGDPY